MTHTHVTQRASVAYEHCGRLFGHDVRTPGVVHAATYLDFQRFVGDRYRTLCGQIAGGRSRVWKTEAGPAVTCARCLKRIARNP